MEQSVPSEVEDFIRKNVPWTKLPVELRQVLGGSPREYEKLVLEFSVKNQVRFKGNLVKTFFKKNEETYYELLISYSKEHLMLYPYHLSDVVVRGLRVTPFQYYKKMVESLICQEKSYDTLPNFTAADVYRLLQIGRNEYIEIMNKCRSSKKFLQKKIPSTNLLPPTPFNIRIEPWWIVQFGHLLESDLKALNANDRRVVDALYDEKIGIFAGKLDLDVIRKLYRFGFIYFDVPIDEQDILYIPPLSNFIMNRITGDYIETILYQIFQAIDGRMPVHDLQSNLNKDLELIQNALSVFCRLGIAHKRNPNGPEILHDSWSSIVGLVKSPVVESKLSVDALENLWSPSDDFAEDSTQDSVISEDSLPRSQSLSNSIADMSISAEDARIAFLFDSSLTAFLMMGNKSADLKAHAVTLFEVGKLSHSAIPGFIAELEKMTKATDSDASRGAAFAQILVTTLRFLQGIATEVDMVRCESLLSLDPVARSRILRKNYRLILSVAPLCGDALPLNCGIPPSICPPSAEVVSPWFFLFLYNLTKSGPASLLLSKGTRLTKMPKELSPFSHIFLSQWSHDPMLVSTDFCLLQLNEALQRSPVFVQEYSARSALTDAVVHVPFPDPTLDYADLLPDLDASTSSNNPANFDPQIADPSSGKNEGNSDPSAGENIARGESRSRSGPLNRHPAVLCLHRLLQLNLSCGYVTLLRVASEAGSSLPAAGGDEEEGSPVVLNNDHIAFEYPSPGDLTRDPRRLISRRCESDVVNYDEWVLFDCSFGLPLFDDALHGVLLKRLQAADILAAEKLSSLEAMNHRIAAMLLEFIAQFCPQVDAQRSAQATSLADQSLIHPSSSVAFESGKVFVWTPAKPKIGEY